MVDVIIRGFVRAAGVGLGLGCLYLVYLGAPPPALMIGIFLLLVSTGALKRIFDAFKA